MKKVRLQLAASQNGNEIVANASFGLSHEEFASIVGSKTRKKLRKTYDISDEQFISLLLALYKRRAKEKLENEPFSDVEPIEVVAPRIIIRPQLPDHLL